MLGTRMLMSSGAGVYTVNYSGDYPGSANGELTKTWGGAATDGKYVAFSTWFKRDTTGSTQVLISELTNGTNESKIYFNSSDQLVFREYTSGLTTTAQTSTTYSTTGTWRHLFGSIDTVNQALVCYVDGVAPTWGSGPTITLNSISRFTLNAGNAKFGGQGGSYFDGHMADTHLVDGSIPLYTDFYSGGTYKEYTGSYGNNGVHFDYAASGDLGNDVSGNNNDFTNAGSVTQSADVPT